MRIDQPCRQNTTRDLRLLLRRRRDYNTLPPKNDTLLAGQKTESAKIQDAECFPLQKCAINTCVVYKMRMIDAPTFLAAEN